MQRFFSILTAGVERFEGTVDKFTGDGIMAVFGAPIAHEDHAPRACYAALQILDDVGEYAAELRRAEGLNFSVRIGINSGEVVAGAIGAGNPSGDYTAIGHTVGLAQRMEALAEPSRAYLTESTAELAAGFLELEDLGEFEIKGASRPMRVFELEGIGGARSRLDLSRERGFSRFVGRGGEMSTLEEALGRAEGGQGGVVAVVADAGVGKSRLCLEFAERARGRGVEVFEAQAQSHGRSIPYMPVLQMMRAYFGDRRRRQGPNRAREDRRQGSPPRHRAGRQPPPALRLPRRPRPRPARSAAQRRGTPARARRGDLPPRQLRRPAGDGGDPGRGPALDGRGEQRDASRPDRLGRGNEDPRGGQLPTRILAALGGGLLRPDRPRAAERGRHERDASRPRR